MDNTYMNHAIEVAENNLTGVRKKAHDDMLDTIESDLVEKLTNLLVNDKQPLHIAGEAQRVIDSFSEELMYIFKGLQKKEAKEYNAR